MNTAQGLTINVRRCGLNYEPNPTITTVEYDLYVKVNSSGEVTNLRHMYSGRHAHHYVTHEFGVVAYEVRAVRYSERNENAHIEIAYSRTIKEVFETPARGLNIDMSIPTSKRLQDLFLLELDEDLGLRVRMPETDCYERQLVFALKVTLARKPDTL